MASKLGPMPPTKVPGKIWVPGWYLTDEPPSTDQSFESLILDKMKGPTTKPAVKRRKCDLKTRVITNEQLLEELKRQEIEAKEKAERKLLGGKRQRKAQKKISFDGNTADDEIEIDENDDVDMPAADDREEEEGMEEEEDIIEENSSNESDDDDGISDEDVLKKVWRSINSPTTEEEITKGWYGAIYQHQKKSYLYVGKATRRFLSDKDGPATSIELDCLKPQVGSGTILQSYDKSQQRDIGIFMLHNVIAGPLRDVEQLKFPKVNVPTYQQLKELYNRVVKIDRESLFKTIYDAE